MKTLRIRGNLQKNKCYESYDIFGWKVYIYFIVSRETFLLGSIF